MKFLWPFSDESAMVVVDQHNTRQIPCREIPAGRFNRRSRWAIVGWAFLTLTLCLCQTGCVQRRMTVRTNPPGALLYVDDYEIGTTPISTSFVFYGTRKITLVKDGYETLTVMQTFPTPWYEVMPLDFFSENVVPGEIRDQRTVDFQLKPQVPPSREQLMARAEDLRRGHYGMPGTPTNPAVPGAAIPGAGQPVVAPQAPIQQQPNFQQPAVPQPVIQQPGAVETIPLPEGVGGQAVHTLPNGR